MPNPLSIDRVNSAFEPKVIKIFLASSFELETDRKEFEIFIGRENRRFIKQGTYIDLNIWEDFIDAMSVTRLQDKYNEVVKGCDIFVSLFFTKVGKYTLEEFESAFGEYKKNGRPIVYTYFKNEKIDISNIREIEINSKFAFEKRLKALGHFPSTYSNIEDLKYKFKIQLDKLLPTL